MGNHSSKSKAEHVNEIVESLQEPYKKQTHTMYWESVIEMRKLVLCLLQLISFDQLRLVLVIVVCIMFLIHHVAMYPYISIHDNRTETLSLSGLILVGLCNFMKCLMKDVHVFSESTLDLFNILYNMEVLMPIVLISFISINEVMNKLV